MIYQLIFFMVFMIVSGIGAIRHQKAAFGRSTAIVRMTGLAANIFGTFSMLTGLIWLLPVLLFITQVYEGVWMWALFIGFAVMFIGVCFSLMVHVGTSLGESIRKSRENAASENVKLDVGTG